MGLFGGDDGAASKVAGKRQRQSNTHTEREREREREERDRERERQRPKRKKRKPKEVKRNQASRGEKKRVNREPRREKTETLLFFSGHELKGMKSYYNCGVSQFSLPLIALLDYRGYR